MSPYSILFLTVLLFSSSCKRGATAQEVVDEMEKREKASLDASKKEAAEQARAYLYGDKDSPALPDPLQPSIYNSDGKQDISTIAANMLSNGVDRMEKIAPGDFARVAKEIGAERLAEWRVWEKEKQWVKEVNAGKIKISDAEKAAYLEKQKNEREKQTSKIKSFKS